MTVGLGNVSVTTTSPGYKLYISMTGDTTGLSGIADGISGNIPATSGTITSPTSLTRGTWGYAIPSSGVAHLVSSGFNTSYAEMSSTTPDSSKKFATPPVSSAPQLIAESSTATSSDNYPIYYGVMANSSTAPGDYSNTVMFTAVADAAATHSMTLSPASANVNAATTLAVVTSLYSTAGYANANIYLLSASQYNSISGTNVEALGVSPLTCTKSGNTPVAYSCSVTAPSTQGEYYIYAKFPVYNVTYASVFNVHNPVTLTVNPNGGTWEGSTSSQDFTQNEGTTKTINNPSTNATYTITYNANNTGATGFPASATVSRNFTGWTTSGGGSISGTTYTFGATNGTLTAGYNSTSNSFTLPAVNKAGHTCKWAEGSTSGTQYNAGTSRTTTGNRTYYAICTANNYTVSITNSNTTSGAASLSIPYGGSKTVTVTPSSGYYLSSVSCPSGYTCTGYSTGTSATGQQTVTITNNNTQAGGTLNFTGTALTLAQMCSNASVGSTFTYSSVDYIKLKTNSAGTTSACYTKTSRGSATWNNAASVCPASTGVPTQAEFQSLINAYGSDGTIYNTTGWSYGYWSSTTYLSNRAYLLSVDSSYARIDYTRQTNSNQVVCIVR